MAMFRVDSDELHGAVASTQASMDSVRAEVAGLMARLNALESSWSGGASAAFQQAVQQWRATQQQVEQVMGSINQALGVAASSYGNVEQDVQRMFAV